MKKWMSFLDNFTAGYIFISTFVVCMSISVAQFQDMNLSGSNRWGFLLGFVGSVVCVIIRFCILYRKIWEQNSLWRGILGLIYSIVLGIGTVIQLLITLHNANYSIAYQDLSGYNSYQIFMIIIMFAQWIGDKLFGVKKC